MPTLSYIIFPNLTSPYLTYPYLQFGGLGSVIYLQWFLWPPLHFLLLISPCLTSVFTFPILYPNLFFNIYLLSFPRPPLILPYLNFYPPLINPCLTSVFSSPLSNLSCLTSFFFLNCPCLTSYLTYLPHLACLKGIPLKKPKVETSRD